jgi:hypothetical protein
MIIQFDIPNDYLTRLGNQLHKYGYVFDAQAGTTDAQQKQQFLKKRTISLWKELTVNGENADATNAAKAALVEFNETSIL